MERKRLLSSVQLSGELHLGNYYGAIKQFVELQESGHELMNASCEEVNDVLLGGARGANEIVGEIWFRLRKRLGLII